VLTRFISILLFLGSVSLAFSQAISTPQISCVSVLPNGDVTISWNPVTDPDGEFIEYELFADATSITTINTIASNSFTHVGSNANTSAVSYQLNINGSGVSGAFTLSSPTFSTIFLDVVNNADGFATLNWSVPPSVNSGKFYIYRSINAAPFELIDSVNHTVNTYQDESFGICSTTPISYRVMHIYPNGCESFSNTDTDTFIDLLSPAEVVLIDLDVNPATGHTTLQWIESPEPDVVEYKILKLNPVTQIFDQIAVIPGKTNTTYTDINTGTQSASVASQSYKIIATDACGFNRGLDFFSTVFIDGSEINCQNSITLRWNPFITGQTSNLQIITSSIVEVAEFYEIWVDGGTGFTFLTQVNKGVFQHTLTNVVPDQLFCYQIRAKLPNGEFSNSNQFCYMVRSKEASLKNYIAYATVTQEETIQLKLYTEKVVSGNTINIYKSWDEGLTFDSIHSQRITASTFNFVDEDVDVHSQSYTYYFVLKDVCNLKRDTSNTVSSIHLSAAYNDYEAYPKFYWNNYAEFDSDVEMYTLSRSVNDANFVKVVELDNTINTYQDTIKTVLTQSFKTLCYVVKATEDNLNQYGFREVAHSNKVCIEDKPTVYVPTGFVIGGVSGNLKPSFTYLVEKNYRFTIYNRWGQPVFDTIEPTEGWDGFFKGNPVPSGTYSYKITFKDANNEDQIMVGSVTVIN
jgi:gliding motility-associated-like protein